MTRFLSREEIRRLHAVLDACVAERPVNAPTADIIRLLLLIGCRRGEILNLQWREVGEDILELVDSKTGPRTVFLNPKAKAVIERQPRPDSLWVFPSPANREKPCSASSLDRLWRMVRKQARNSACPHHGRRRDRWILLYTPCTLQYQEWSNGR